MELTENEQKFVKIMNEERVVSITDLIYKHKLKFSNMHDVLVRLEQLGFLIYEEEYMHKVTRGRKMVKTKRYGIYDVVKGSRAESILENI